MLLPLLALLIFSAPAAVQPPSYEQVWRDSRVATDRGELAAAMKLVDEALARAGNSQDAMVWALRVQRATLLIVGKQYPPADAILSQPLPPNVRDSATGARHLLAVAMLKWYRGEPDLALIERARAVAARHGPRALPEVLMVRAQLTGSEADVKEALRLARKDGDDVTAAKAEASLVLTYGTSGRFAEAIDAGERLLPQLAAARLTMAHQKIVGNLGWIYAEAGDYDRGAELLTQAHAEAERLGELSSAQIWFTTLTNVHASRRDWQSVIRYARQIIAATEKQKSRSRGHAFSALARAYVETGRFAEAREAVRQALALEEVPEDELITRLVQARIDLATGAHAPAVKTLIEIGGRTARPDTRLEARAQLAHVYAVRKQNQLAEKTFLAALGAAREAHAALKGNETQITYFNKTSELFDDYIDFLVDSGRSEDALRATETSRAQTLAEALGLDDSGPLDPKKLAKAHDATILCYWLGRNRSYVWTITPTAIRLTALEPDAEIEREVASYGAKLITSAGTLQRSGAQGQALYDLLVAKAAAGVPRGARVIVVPDGRLHTLNFETLVTPAKTYWIEDVVLANASSLRLLTRGGAEGKRMPNMLLVGNPPQADPVFPVLPQAGEEIQRIEKRFPGRATVLAGPRATPAAYKAAKPQGYDFVHFVAHGAPARIRPLDSAVILGLDADRKYRLAARDIAKQPLAARLVTISSCHGAGTTTYAGEGLVGLAWAFLHAGARQVVAALWAVKDSAAPRLMDEFYAGIRSGRDPAVALRDAKLALLRSKTSQQHPRYWAPFVIYQ